MESRVSQLQVVNFSTRDFKGSIDINFLAKVISMPRLSMAPTGPDYLIGLLNLAGTVIPVIDLSMRLKVSRPDKYTINTPVLICKTSQNQCFGVVVDEVHDITKITPEMMQANVSSSDKNKLVSGTIKYNDTISLIINVDQLLDDNITH